jgi:hypothetical protein
MATTTIIAAERVLASGDCIAFKEAGKLHQGVCAAVFGPKEYLDVRRYAEMCRMFSQ